MNLISSQIKPANTPSFAYSILSRQYIGSNSIKHRHGSRIKSGIFDNLFQNLANQLGVSSQSQEEEEEYEEEASTFVPLEQQSGEQTFGPLALLAVGFLADEFHQLQAFLEDLGADDVSLLPCTTTMLLGTLGEALLQYEDPPKHETPKQLASSSSQQRVIFLSGMYSQEVMEVVSGYKEDGLPDTAFAAAVPKSWNRNLAELIDDVSADHAAMLERRRQLSNSSVTLEEEQQ